MQHLNNKSFAALVDMVELSPDTSLQTVDVLTDDACRLGFHAMGCPYCYHPHVIDRLRACGHFEQVVLIGGAGFADGNWPTEVKLSSISRCMSLGCGEIDLTSNLGWIKSGMWKTYQQELELVRNETRGVPLKVIVHAPQLEKKELKRACDIVANIEADFIKTDTGRSPTPSTAAQVRYIRLCVGTAVKIKASGGIRSVSAAEEMIAAGAERLGLSRSSALRIYRELSIAAEV